MDPAEPSSSELPHPSAVEARPHPSAVEARTADSLDAASVPPAAAAESVAAPAAPHRWHRPPALLPAAESHLAWALGAVWADPSTEAGVGGRAPAPAGEAVTPLPAEPEPVPEPVSVPAPPAGPTGAVARPSAPGPARWRPQALPGWPDEQLPGWPTEGLAAWRQRQLARRRPADRTDRRGAGTPTWPTVEELVTDDEGRVTPGGGHRRRSRPGRRGPGAGGGALWTVGVPVVALVLLVAMVVALNRTRARRPMTRTAAVAAAGNAGVADALAGQAGTVAFVPATTPPAPAPPSVAGGPPLVPHEVFGFAPYWTLGSLADYPVSAFTTIAYFSVGVTGTGSLVESGPGWDGVGSRDLADLVTAAHGDAHRVVLTLSCFDQPDLGALVAQPQATARRLAAQVVPLLQAEHLDGINLDFEGSGPADRAGLDRWVATFAALLRAADSSWQLTMDTYGSSAGDPGGFFDVAGLARSVDALVVMAYDMGSRSNPSPTAPLAAAGFSDAQALDQYLGVVPASKVILGIPTYGYDWPTTGPGLGATATGPPTAVTYAQVAGGRVSAYWDPTTATPWAEYRQGSQWYEVFFDDPASVALKAQLAGVDHLAGVAEWALGFDGGSGPMVAALLGQPQPQTLPVGPGSTAPPSVAGGPGSAPPTGASTSGNGAPVSPAGPSTAGGSTAAGSSAAGQGSSKGAAGSGAADPGGSAAGASTGTGGSASTGTGGSASTGTGGSGSTGTGGSGGGSGQPLGGLIGKL